MPIRHDDEQRITLFRAHLLAVGLIWNKHYILFDEGVKWAIDYIQPMTAEQYNVAEAALNTIMNK